jgi:phosphosulfolactate synthase
MLQKLITVRRKKGMEASTQQPLAWPKKLSDPSGKRTAKPRKLGTTMVIDKGLGIHAFEDLLATAGEHIDMIKIGFGTTMLYPPALLAEKIELAKARGILIYPGGTLLEAAVAQGLVNEFLRTADRLGYTGIEVSDGTIEMDIRQRSKLIRQAVSEGFTVVSEYGKKCWGSSIDIDELLETVHEDREAGSSLVTIEGRESGAGVGIYDEKGKVQDEQVLDALRLIPDSRRVIMWEAPQKDQQVHLIKLLGPDIHIGNVAPQDIISLEALRRGLRSDTFGLGLIAETAGVNVL